MGGAIFISYRRKDDPGFTRALVDLLKQEFPADQLFFDVDAIPPGEDFVRVIEERVRACHVLFAVIGQGWLHARDDLRHRRLDDPNDFVRIEIQTALAQGKLVIPVLVNEAVMPRAEDLPESMRDFTRRTAVSLSHERFETEAKQLAKYVAESLVHAEALAQRAAEEEAARLERERQKVEDAEREEKERRRAGAVSSLFPEQLARAEELVAKLDEHANWDFIKNSSDPVDLQRFIDRFPGGECQKMARVRLKSLSTASQTKSGSRISRHNAANIVALTSLVAFFVGAYYYTAGLGAPSEQLRPSAPVGSGRRPPDDSKPVHDRLGYESPKFDGALPSQDAPVDAVDRTHKDDQLAPLYGFNQELMTITDAVPNPEIPSGYFVQVTSNVDQNRARAAVAEFQNKHGSTLGSYTFFIQRADIAAKVWHRVWVGPVASREAATDLCNKLIADGLKECVVKKN